MGTVLLNFRNKEHDILNIYDSDDQNNEITLFMVSYVTHLNFFLPYIKNSAGVLKVSLILGRNKSFIELSGEIHS